MNAIDSIAVTVNGGHRKNKTGSIKAYLDNITDELLDSLPPAAELSSTQRRGMIARYAAVLEGNFIYWMTGAYLATRSDDARAIIIDNLLEEVRDSHPAMLRRFVTAAHAQPTDTDALMVARNLMKVRLFIGCLTPVPILAMMAFFESFIQRYMPYLEELAQMQGSAENEYTQVHGVCDIAHSDGLFRGLESEMAISAESGESEDDIYQGVHLLQALIDDIFIGKPAN